MTGGLDIGPGHFGFLRHRVYRQDAQRLTLDLRFGYAGLVLAADLDDAAATVTLRVASGNLPADAAVALWRNSGETR
jgi:hypothetical protein